MEILALIYALFLISGCLLDGFKFIDTPFVPVIILSVPDDKSIDVAVIPTDSVGDIYATFNYSEPVIFERSLDIKKSTLAPLVSLPFFFKLNFDW